MFSVSHVLFLGLHLHICLLITFSFTPGGSWSILPGWQQGSTRGRVGFCPLCSGQLLDGAFPNQPQGPCRGSRLSWSKTSWGQSPTSIQYPTSVHPAMWALQVCPSRAPPGEDKTSISVTATSRAALAPPGHRVPSLPQVRTWHAAFGPQPAWPGSTAFPQQWREAPKDTAHHVSPAFQVRPETERYEWVFIKKPELAKAVPRSRQRSPSPSPASLLGSSPDGRSTSSNRLAVPAPQRKGRLSPFLAIRHFLLPSKTASMFMSGSREGIIIGNYRMAGTDPLTHRCFG